MEQSLVQKHQFELVYKEKPKKKLSSASGKCIKNNIGITPMSKPSIDQKMKSFESNCW